MTLGGYITDRRVVERQFGSRQLVRPTSTSLSIILARVQLESIYSDQDACLAIKDYGDLDQGMHAEAVRASERFYGVWCQRSGDLNLGCHLVM